MCFLIPLVKNFRNYLEICLSKFKEKMITIEDIPLDFVDQNSRAMKLFNDWNADWLEDPDVKLTVVLDYYEAFETYSH